MARSFSDSFSTAFSGAFVNTYEKRDLERAKERAAEKDSTRRLAEKDMDRRNALKLSERRAQTIREETKELVASGDYVEAGMSFDPDTGAAIPIIETREKAQQRQALLQLEQLKVGVQRTNALTALTKAQNAGNNNMMKQFERLRRIAGNNKDSGSLLQEIERSARMGLIPNDQKTKDAAFNYARNFKRTGNPLFELMGQMMVGGLPAEQNTGG